jgi:lipopolysaccharide export LptBFGC system permease protein LptF
MNQQNQTKQDTSNSFAEVFSSIVLLIVSFVLSSIVLVFISSFLHLGGFVKYFLSIIVFFVIFFGLSMAIPFFKIYLMRWRIIR